MRKDLDDLFNEDEEEVVENPPKQALTLTWVGLVVLVVLVIGVGFWLVRGSPPEQIIEAQRPKELVTVYYNLPEITADLVTPNKRRKIIHLTLVIVTTDPQRVSANQLRIKTEAILYLRDQTIDGVSSPHAATRIKNDLITKFRDILGDNGVDDLLLVKILVQ